MYKKIFREMYKLIPDRLYIEFIYFRTMHKKLNLQNPRLFSEKIQWLKLYDRNLEYTNLVDKYKVREYVSKKIGSKYLVPLLGKWDNVDEIDFKMLPNKFVLKLNHDSGSVVICKNKKNMNLVEIKKKLKKKLQTNYYWSGREWPYKYVKPKILAEELLESSEDIIDYKFFCFSGEPKYCQVIKDRTTNETIDFFNEQWEHQEFIGLSTRPNEFNNSKNNISRPINFYTMLKLASILSEDIPFVRVDFYNLNGKIYFGEMTFYPASGFAKFYPDQWNNYLGNLINLNDLRFSSKK